MDQNETTSSLDVSLRDLARTAMEHELRKMLNELHARFVCWDRGEMSSSDLCDAILAFPRKSEELHRRYRPSDMLEAVVAEAISRGVLDRSTLEPKMLEHLSRLIEFFEPQKTG